MITKEKLERWTHGKTELAAAPVSDSVLLAYTEMLIELKSLRQENFHLLNVLDVLDKMAAYINETRSNHYISEELDFLYGELLDTIERTGVRTTPELTDD